MNSNEQKKDVCTHSFGVAIVEREVDRLEDMHFSIFLAIHNIKSSTVNSVNCVNQVSSE